MIGEMLSVMILIVKVELNGSIYLLCERFAWVGVAHYVLFVFQVTTTVSKLSKMLPILALLQALGTQVLAWQTGMNEWTSKVYFQSAKNWARLPI